MKKISLSLLLLLVSMVTFAQVQKVDVVEYVEDEELVEIAIPHKNEVKLNLGGLALAHFLDVSYERVINEDFGAGAAFMMNLDGKQDSWYQFTPYARWYFGGSRKTARRVAAGFFIEGNAGIVNREVTNNVNSQVTKESETNFGLGVALGWKYVTRRNWIGELFIGGGRTFNDDAYTTAYPRFGISIGKRF